MSPPRKSRRKPTLVGTELAALYALMLADPENKIQLFRESEVDNMRRRIYNAARDHKLTRHGGSGRGEARWDLNEIHATFAKPPK
ncbi:hypothetical protein [Streptomyces sioyaensis]|uniref:hypothetical protein n=1 Tax=Streptomyces sioyaensis TaxID=67364 RepID=UPI003EB6CF34